MSKNKFKLSYSGVGQMLKSTEMQKVLSDKASEVKKRAGDGYEQDVYVGKNRANAMVRASTYKAKRDNMKNNTLLKAVR
ncbi:hypothetical protein JZO72_03705 [Vagococcus fluvialis]|uniref:hypothetical protein n=1 Tax=Vagococcus fluvialis TaxID=2738 RepID=UPI001A8D6411|nr:hypothetical protein [Vagococcus fluvialis]MBO0478726.1 hypothetical protein [Vagococcus fluvialis]MBO0484429.1 hypothetical protein [Vagococcus fluvialis]